jgi:hypothetical protein
MKIKLVMELPDKTTPGFLRRSRQAMSFSERLKAGSNEPALCDEMVEFLLPFVKEPADRKQARECLWDASQEQFEKAMAAIVGSPNPTPAESSTPSPSSTSPTA